MKTAQFMRICICILGLTPALFSSVDAQDHSEDTILFDWSYSDSPHLQIWLFDTLASEVTSVADIQRQKGQILDFLVDIPNQSVYFVETDAVYGPIGENRIVRYHWPTDTEEVIYTQFNILAISQHFQDNKLVVWYYAEDVEYPRIHTPLFSCLLDVVDQICDGFGNGTHERNLSGANWIWLNDTQVLLLDNLSATIELIDTETDEIRTVVSIDDVDILFWQNNPLMSGILLIGVATDWWQADGGMEYLFYQLDPRTFEVSLLSSSLTPYRIEVPYLALSPDGKYLAFLQRESPYERRDSDHVRVVEIETGNLIYSSPLKTVSSSGDELSFDYYLKWTEDSTGLLGIAYVSSAQANFIVHRSILTGEIDLVTPIEPGVRFVEPWRVRRQ